MRKHFALRLSLFFSLIAFLVAPAPMASAQIEGSSGSAQSSQSPDCADPLLANSVECQTNNSNGAQTPNARTPNLTGIQPFPTPGTVPRPGMTPPRTFNDLTTPNGSFNPSGNSFGVVSQKPLPPQPLTPFQKFVAGTTGEVLPIFGANLFRNVPSTFAPVNNAPIPPDYLIGPGDELRVRIWGQINFNANITVDRSGDIYLPQVGEVHVAGLPYEALSSHLHAAVARVFRNFNLTADIGQIRAVQVYVVGAAHQPGTYTVSALSTLVDAIFASGGPSVEGSMRHIYLKRGGKTIVDFDLYDLLVKGDESKNTTLQSGDVIFFPPAGPQVAITGSVRRPGIYELLNSHTTIGQLLQYAGGASTLASNSRISIDRIDNHRDRRTMQVAFDAQGLATTLRRGDILRVLSIVPRFRKTVTLRGYVANPGRFAWHPGMRLSDLIPDQASLLSRGYWWKREQLGLPEPAFEPVPALAAQSQPSQAVNLRERERNFPANPAQCDQFNAAYDSDFYHCGGAQSGSQNSGGFFNNGSSAMGGSNSQQRQQQQLQRARQSSLHGSQTSLAAGQAEVTTENTAGALEHTSVKLPAPEIDWDYAVIERLNPVTLKTTLIPFDLGKLVMDHDAKDNLALQPGDVVTVFSQADIHVPVEQQTKFVKLEGEFVHAGVYSVKPGETLPELVKQAGGLTPDAYLYGSEFTRVSTRILQQQRIDQYVRNLQADIVRGTLAQASSAVATGQDMSGANAAQASEQQLIARLQQVRATGRIVLEMNPNSGGIAALPPIQLQDGDTFIVPSRPATVNVVGAVYDQNSFLYAPGRTVGDYLRLAGGPNRDADKKHAFLIRADGSVLSRSSTSSLWGNNFNSVRLNPGDTIVVPQKVIGKSNMRELLQWSQMFSSLAFGAAAINVLQ